MILTCPFAPLFAKPSGLFPRELLDNWPTQVHCGTGLEPGGVQFVQRSVAGVKGGGGGGRRADSGKEAVPQADRPPAREGAGSGSALGALTSSQQRPWDWLCYLCPVGQAHRLPRSHQLPASPATRPATAHRPGLPPSGSSVGKVSGCSQ